MAASQPVDIGSITLPIVTVFDPPDESNEATRDECDAEAQKKAMVAEAADDQGVAVLAKDYADAVSDADHSRLVRDRLAIEHLVASDRARDAEVRAAKALRALRIGVAGDS